eukprot:1988_1
MYQLNGKLFGHTTSLAYRRIRKGSFYWRQWRWRHGGRVVGFTIASFLGCYSFYIMITGEAGKVKQQNWLSEIKRRRKIYTVENELAKEYGVDHLRDQAQPKSAVYPQRPYVPMLPHEARAFHREMGREKKRKEEEAADVGDKSETAESG